MPGAPTAVGLGVALIARRPRLRRRRRCSSRASACPGSAPWSLAWVELATPTRLVRAGRPDADRRGRAVRAADRARSAPACRRRRRAHRPGPAQAAWRSGRGGRARSTRTVWIRGRGRRRLDAGPARGPRPARPAGARRSRASDPGELLVLPRIEPVVLAGARRRRDPREHPRRDRGGRRDASARRSRDRARGRRPARLPRGHAGVAHPLARRRPAPAS